MKILFLILSALLITGSGQLPKLDKEQARSAYVLLNKIRKNPQSYAREMPFLGEVKAMPALKWNDTLAKAAEAKALDMARRNYFAHVDPDGYGMNYHIMKAGYRLDSSWTKNPKANYFESCNAGGQTGEEVIRMLLIDEGVPNAGHRKHLLGIDSWSSGLYDIGIGYARSDSSSFYKTYTCVLIAKHSK